jgi:hypothetical protein
VRAIGRRRSKPPQRVTPAGIGSSPERLLEDGWLARRSSPIATSQARREGSEPGEGLLKRVVAQFFSSCLTLKAGAVMGRVDAGPLGERIVAIALKPRLLWFRTAVEVSWSISAGCWPG